MVITDDSAHLTERCGPALAALGLAVDALHGAGPLGRPACRPCLNWGERRMHLAGRLGALLCTHVLERGWLVRRVQSRALELTPAGAVAFRDGLGTARWQSVGQPAH